MANLTEKQDKFCDLMAEGGLSKTAAYRKAGYKAEKSASQNAHELCKNLAGEIANRVKIRMANHAPKLLEGLIFLATSAETESVRLAAIKDVLDRTGYRPVEQREELAPKRDRAALEAELAGYVGKEKATEIIEGLQPEPSQRAAIPVSVAEYEGAANFNARKAEAEAAKKAGEMELPN